MVKKLIIFSLIFLALFPSVVSGVESPLVFMVLPVESPTAMYESFLPLARYLEKKLNRRVNLVVARSGDTALKDMQQGKIDMAYICSVFYVIAHDNYGYVPLARSVEKDRREERGVILVKGDSDIKEINDLNGRSLALGSRYCASSNLLQRFMLKQAGLREEDLFMIDIVGHNRRAILSVMSGLHDAAGVTESVADEYKGMGLRYIAVSPPSPTFVFAVKFSMPSALKARTKEILTGMSRTKTGDLKVLNSISSEFSGFEAVDDSEYNTVRELIKKVKINWRQE